MIERIWNVLQWILRLTSYLIPMTLTRSRRYTKYVLIWDPDNNEYNEWKRDDCIEIVIKTPSFPYVTLHFFPWNYFLSLFSVNNKYSFNMVNLMNVAGKSLLLEKIFLKGGVNMSTLFRFRVDNIRHPLLDERTKKKDTILWVKTINQDDDIWRQK